ncbi:hypothetical protein ACFZB9_10880 [Kitasatospora sp. NPDC008050]
MAAPSAWKPSPALFACAFCRSWLAFTGAATVCAGTELRASEDDC